MKRTISLSMDSKVVEALEQHANKIDRSVSSSANKIIKEVLTKVGFIKNIEPQGGEDNENGKED